MPIPRCARVIDSNEIKSQAHSGNMGEQDAVVYTECKVVGHAKNGKPKIKQFCGFVRCVHKTTMSSMCGRSSTPRCRSGLRGYRAG